MTSRSARRFVATALGLSALAVVIGAYKTWQAGEWRTIEPRPLDCRTVDGVIGPEDITIDSKRGVAYLSSNDWRALQFGEATRGAIYRYALSDGPNARPMRLPDGLGADFHPHGIALWSDGAGPDRLYVVNHPTRNTHAIEVFDVTGEGLVHVRTLRDPALVSPNDLVAVGRDRLYVTNDHGVSDRGLQLAHDVLGLARADVVHFDGTGFTRVAEGLAYANGIQISADGTRLYVAETTGKRIRVYKLNDTQAPLALEQTIMLDTGVDNIERAEDGSLFIGAHPKLLTFLRHAKDPTVPSPSEVIHLENGTATTVYLDPGTQLSASTVAAPLRDRLLIGAVFGSRFLDCARP
jgi:arylesterase / paraoxonase